MPKLEQYKSWVIYQTVNKGVVTGPNSVCEQDEWDELERLRPGAQVLVKTGLASEGVAERLARGTSGDPVPRGAKGRAK
jgi:hypothetical protein